MVIALINIIRDIVNAKAWKCRCQPLDTLAVRVVVPETVAEKPVPALQEFVPDWNMLFGGPVVVHLDPELMHLSVEKASEWSGTVVSFHSQLL